MNSLLFRLCDAYFLFFDVINKTAIERKTRVTRSDELYGEIR